MGIRVFKPYEDEKRAMMKCFGNFTVNAFPLTDSKGNSAHSNSDGTDCECYGFLIHHPEITNFLYATDCSFVKWNFKKHKIHHFLVECNYSDEYINLDHANKNHVLKGHMELQTCKKFIEANTNPRIETVTICHLSESNSNPSEFVEEVQKVTEAKVDYAKKGKVIELNTLPF